MAACLAVSRILPVCGQELIFDSPQDKYLLSEEIQILPESGRYATIEDILEAGGEAVFTAPGQGPFQSGKYYWARAKLINRLDSVNGPGSWVVHFAPSLTHIEAFLVREGHVISRHHSGYFRPYYQKEFHPRVQPNLIKIGLGPGEAATLYFRVKSDRKSMPPEFWAEVKPVDAFWKELGKAYWSNGLFLGFVLMMLIYNLILSVIVRDKAHFFYSCYLVTIAGYQLYASRLLADWLAPGFFPEHPQYLYFFKLVTYGGLASYLGFIRSFLQLERLMPAWDRWFRALMALAVPVMLADAFLIWYSNYSPNIADWATIPFSIIFLISTFLFVWPLYRTRNKKGFFIVAGILFMGLGILFTILERLQSIEYSLVYFKIGSVLEIIAFALGLGYSRRLEAHERQEQRFELEKSRLLQAQEKAEAERLKELDNLKSNLYTNITHEFRTPLAVIMGLAAEIEGNEKARRIIQRNSNNLLRLINQMLTLSKLESGQLKLNLRQADIIAYLKYLAESFHSLASGKQIRLAFYANTPSLLMDFDEEKIQQVVYNLLSNALKFTPGQGEVAFRVQESQWDGQPALQISVQDTGIGISQGQLPFIFDRFYQAPPKTGESEEGGDFSSLELNRGSSGIGLALTKELVELQGGTIGVESELGVGSKFIVRLPLTRNAERKETTWTAKLLPGSGLADESLAADPVAPAGDKPILLLVEDNPDVVTYIRTILDDNYAVHVAPDGAEGLAQALELIPDIIISDVMMPEMDGFELCGQLKQDTRTSHVPIVLLTARTASEDKIAGLQHGADAYLTKPFHKKELLLLLENMVEARKRLQQYLLGKGRGDTAGEAYAAKENTFLQKLREVVEASIDDQNLSVYDLCEAANLGHTQVYRKLKALTDKTPSQFIRSIRLERAMELLNSTDKNVSEIAYEVGFNDPNYFSRSFLQEYGMPPSTVRQ